MVIHNFPETVILNAGNAHQWKVRKVGGKSMAFPLWEEEHGLVYNGKPVLPRIRYVFLPDGSSRRKISAAGNFLSRSMLQAPRWQACSGIGIMEFHEIGQWYETVSLLPDADASMDCPLVWHRYLATDDPDAEKPGDCGVRLNRLTADCEVAGLEGYCEKICIPAYVNGRRVNRVDLPDWSRSPYLREFVVQKGIPLIRMNFDIETLERIEIPEDCLLAEPPDGILNTAWFQRQQGDVYFHGYYCGTRGKASEPVLHLKEGTVGILAGARAGEGRKSVVLPDSLCYIGPDALGDVPGFQRQQVFRPAAREERPAGISGRNVTAENLYNLGRTGFAAGCLIAKGYEPVAPRLTYDSGWIAHYYYTNEFCKDIQYYLSVDLATGMPAAFDKLDSAACIRPICRRQDSPTAHYYWAEDYLTRAAALIKKNAHSSRDLDALEERWRSILPHELKSGIHHIIAHMEESGNQNSHKKGGK